MSFNPLSPRSPSEQDTVPNWYQTKSWLLIFSLLIATAIVYATWPWEDIRERSEKDFCLDVEVVIGNDEIIVTDYEQGNLPSACTGTSPQNESAQKKGVQVYAKVEGPTHVLDRLEKRQSGWKTLQFPVQPKNIGDDDGDPFYINLSNHKKLLEELDRNFKDVKILDNSPKQIRYKTKSLEEREFTIKESLKGDLPKGFQISKITIEPDKIAVFAPDSPDEHQLSTMPIDLSEITESETVFERKIDLPTNYRVVDKKNEDVKVTIKVLPTEQSLLLSPLDIQLRNNRFEGGTLYTVPASISRQAHINVNPHDGTSEQGDVSIEAWETMRDECMKDISSSKMTAFIDVKGLRTQEDLPENAKFVVTLEGEPKCVNDVEFQPEEVELRVNSNTE